MGHSDLYRGLDSSKLYRAVGHQRGNGWGGFCTYIREVLAPEIEPGTVVICDNLATHKNAEAAAALRENGCWFLFLPPYSPDLNPIEMAFAKLKAHLRRIGARTFNQMFDALAEVCDLFTPNECWNYCREAGYDSD